MRFSPMICVLGLALLAAPMAQAGPEVGDYRALAPDLAAAATAYDVAQFKADKAALQRLLADDYLLAGLDGRNTGKAEAIAGATAPGAKATSVALSQLVHRTWPNGAALGGVVDAKGLDHGKPFALHARFIDIWAKRDGRWQVVFTQIHRLA